METSNFNHPKEDNKVQLKAFSGTLISSILIFLAIFFISFKTTKPPFPETPVFIDVSNIDLSGQMSGAGELAALGENDYGMPGTTPNTPPPTAPQNMTSTTTSPGGTPTNDRILTQNTEDVNVNIPKSGNSKNSNTNPPRQTDPRYSFSHSNNPNNSQGTGNTPGYQGSSTGDPNSNNYNPAGGAGMDGLYQLGNRKVKEKAPRFEDNTQKAEKIVIAIVVDRKGNVVSAEATFRNGGTTVTGPLVVKAIAAAKKVKFDADPNAPEEQYGTITFNFKLN